MKPGDIVVVDSQWWTVKEIFEDYFTVVEDDSWDYINDYKWIEDPEGHWECE